MPTPPPSGLDTLARLIDALVPEMSDARARQYRMVLGELTRATAHQDFPAGPDAPLDELLSGEAVTAYLDLAARGELRANAAHLGRPSTASTALARMRTLDPLAAAAGYQLDLGPLPRYHHRTPVPSRQREILRRYLTRQADRRQTDPYRIRLLALVGIVLDTGAPVNSLALMQPASLLKDNRAIVVERQLQGRHGTRSTDTVPLRVGTRAAVKAWLEERERWVAPLHGESVALWVSLHPNHTGEEDGTGARRPPGMPLQPKGIQRAYAQAIGALNGEMVGRAGWTPMPTTLEELRRGVERDRRAKAEARQRRGA